MTCTDYTIDVTTQTLTVNVTEPTFTVDIDESFTEFIELTDTPTSYSGQADKFLKVNSGENAIEFITSVAVVSWGGILGTLSNQTDLQAELDLKYDAADFNGDWDTRLATKTTTNLSEGTNLYYTEVRVSANSDVSANTTHRSSDGKNHSDVVLNNTHRSSDGSDHTFINQSVTTTSGPSFSEIKIAGKVYLDFSSNTYFEYNSTTGEVELYVQGGIKASW